VRNSRTDGDAVWVMDLGGHKKHALDGVQIAMLRGNFQGTEHAHLSENRAQ